MKFYQKAVKISVFLAVIQIVSILSARAQSNPELKITLKKDLNTYLETKKVKITAEVNRKDAVISWNFKGKGSLQEKTGFINYYLLPENPVHENEIIYAIIYYKEKIITKKMELNLSLLKKEIDILMKEKEPNQHLSQDNTDQPKPPQDPPRQPDKNTVKQAGTQKTLRQKQFDEEMQYSNNNERTLTNRIKRLEQYIKSKLSEGYQVTLQERLDALKKERTEKLADSVPIMVAIPGKNFEMCEHEVTKKEFSYFCRENELSDAACNDFENSENNMPVNMVSWYDAINYAEWLTDLDPVHIYRLPAEEEWEYAAGAGKDQDYCWGKKAEHACIYSNVLDETAKRKDRGIQLSGMHIFHCDDGFASAAPVCSYEKNRFGFCDMTGNLWEWTADCPPEQWIEGICAERIVKGGSWFSGPNGAKIKASKSYPAMEKNNMTGFRLVRTPH